MLLPTCVAPLKVSHEALFIGVHTPSSTPAQAGSVAEMRKLACTACALMLISSSAIGMHTPTRSVTGDALPTRTMQANISAKKRRLIGPAGPFLEERAPVIEHASTSVELPPTTLPPSLRICRLQLSFELHDHSRLLLNK